MLYYNEFLFLLVGLHVSTIHGTSCILGCGSTSTPTIADKPHLTTLVDKTLLNGNFRLRSSSPTQSQGIGNYYSKIVYFIVNMH